MKVKYKYIHRFMDRHGRMRYYYRRPGFARVSLPGEPDSREFRQAYDAADRGKPLPIGVNREKPRSLGALITAYYETAEFKQLKPSSKMSYRNTLEKLRVAHGEKPAGLMKRVHVAHIVSEHAATPSTANAIRKRLGALMRLAIVLGWRSDDPTRDVRAVKSKGHGHKTWTEEDIAKFRAFWPSGSKPRLAFELLLCTGQRRCDVIRMGRQHLRGGGVILLRRGGAASLSKLEIIQKKTGIEVPIPIMPALQAELDRVPRDQPTFLVTAAGRPFSEESFSKWFRDAEEQAGIPPGLTPHGLRKAFARRLAECGCSARQIMAVGGWKTEKEVTRYTEAANKVLLAESAIARLTGAGQEP